MNKVVSKKQIKGIVQRLKKKGKKIVFTNGCFDIIHAGHIRYLRKSKKLGDVLIVGLNSDSSVRKIKGRERPINNQRDRAEILSALEFIDYIVIFNEETPEDLIRIVLPDILVKGSDWKGKKVAGENVVKNRGGRIVFMPLLKGRSTTGLIEKIKQL